MRIIFKDRQLTFWEEHLLSGTPISETYRILDEVLSDHKLIKTLAKDIPDVQEGRHRLAVEQTLRVMILKHQKQLSYRDLERQLKYDLEDRWFCKISEAPCFKTLQNQLALIKEETIKKINDLVMKKAVELKLTKGSKMRVDSTVTEMNIHYPTDASLLGDGLRLVDRGLKKIGVKQGVGRLKSSFKKLVNRVRSLGRVSKEVMKECLGKMLTLSEKAIEQVKSVKDKSLRQTVRVYRKVIKQTQQVIKGIKQIPDRTVSFFESTARPIRRGKVGGKSTEFGQVVQIQEDEHFVSTWNISDKKQDEAYLSKALKEHQRIFNRKPKSVATDRGYWSEENYQHLRDAGIRQISMPKKGKLGSHEKKRQRKKWFKDLQKYRAGGEAKISWLKRCFGLDRCLYRREQGFGRWVGAGILANNLIVMTKLMTA
jgi:IS5 family transposase